jgi:D-alanyl-D-alanine carboxypeptidase/D-alanyl-D-alanine-endopeptidase (penicillin-binding protein 4)
MSPRVVVLMLIQVTLAGAWSATDDDRLRFQVETADGREIASQRPDEPFNPASVVKVGTSLWALERLGADHRFVTRFGFSGRFEPESGTIAGDLIVTGGGDPDFHLENVALVARELNAIGIERVTGDLAVAGLFWLGWEHGVEGRLNDPEARARVMGVRLLEALDSTRWDAGAETAWHELCARRGWPDRPRPRLVVAGDVRQAPSGEVRPLAVHRSNPLAVTLKRFNTYSNNDLIRIAEPLGGAAALEAYLSRRLEVHRPALELSTASGERRNRMTARTAVELMRQFVAATGARGVRVADVLVVPGCDPGPTRRMFPRFASGPYANTVVCKTGTLTATDGGTVVLSGLVRSRRHGELLFCVAAPRTGHAVSHWRRIEQEWLIDLIDGAGGAEPVACGGAFPMSDTYARVEIPTPPAAGG